MKLLSAALVLVAVCTHAATLPAFTAQVLGPTAGFATSIAIDSRGTIYYTEQGGNIFRFDNGRSTVVATVNTNQLGNSGLLGMALINDFFAVVHYTTFGQTADIISTVDLTSGTEAVLETLQADKDDPNGASSPEHHGGNPSVGADGSIVVGIGDVLGYQIAADPEWNPGKIFRVHPNGQLEQFARGFRNPFGVVWDVANQRVIATDNGDVGNDEINIVHVGDFCGWPYTEGTKPPVPGAVPPIYTFPMTVAPTGILALSGRSAILRRGYLICSFVTKTIYWVPDIDARPFPDPIPLVNDVPDGIIDVAEGPEGEILFVTGKAVYKLFPIRQRAVRTQPGVR